MRYLKIILILSASLFLFSCGTLKEGFSNQKKNNSDEFLVEKKAPLVMPPDYKELPKPKKNEETSLLKDNKNNIKSLLINEDNLESNSEKDQLNKKLEESLLDKIKKN
tara:strand:- start:248 stop:571 length:324 start_codon:yes stop_codon:yes gene_type:complete